MRCAALLALALAACPGKKAKPKPPPPVHGWAWGQMVVAGPESAYVARWSERTGVVTEERRVTLPGEWRTPRPMPDWSANPQGETRLMRFVADWGEQVVAMEPLSPRPEDPLIGRAAP